MAKEKTSYLMVRFVSQRIMCFLIDQINENTEKIVNDLKQCLDAKLVGFNHRLNNNKYNIIYL